MAFNFMSFLGGAAEQLTDVIETREAERMYEERQVKAEQREESRFAKRQAASAARDRKKAEEEAADMISALSVFYPKSMTEQIASKGKVFGNFALESAQTAVSKGINPSTIWNFATNEKGEVDQSVITETLEVPTPTPAPAPDDLVQTTTSPLSLDVDAYADMFVKPDKEELSHNARIAVLDQKMSRNPNSSNMETWKAEREAMLKGLADLKKLEKDAEGTTTPSFTLGTIQSNMAGFDRASLPRAGFKLGINDNIENLEDGNMHMMDIASLDTVKQATEFNAVYSDPAMKAAISARRNSALRGLQEYAFDALYDTTKTVEELTPQKYAEAMQNNQLKVGQIIKVGNFLHVYTGIEDTVTGYPFYDFAIGTN